MAHVEKTLINFQKELTSFEENERLLGILQPTRVRGYDQIFLTAPLRFNLIHTTGIIKTREDGVTQSPQTGVLVTPQGIVVQQEGNIEGSTPGSTAGLDVNSNTGNPETRIDLVIYEHTYIASPGTNPGTISIIQGANNDPNPPSLTNPPTQTIIGRLTIPAEATALTTDMWTPETSRSIGGVDILARTEVLQFLRDSGVVAFRDETNLQQKTQSWKENLSGASLVNEGSSGNFNTGIKLVGDGNLFYLDVSSFNGATNTGYAYKLYHPEEWNQDGTVIHIKVVGGRISLRHDDAIVPNTGPLNPTHGITRRLWIAPYLKAGELTINIGQQEILSFYLSNTGWAMLYNISNNGRMIGDSFLEYSAYDGDAPGKITNGVNLVESLARLAGAYQKYLNNPTLGGQYHAEGEAVIAQANQTSTLIIAKINLGNNLLKSTLVNWGLRIGGDNAIGYDVHIIWSDSDIGVGGTINASVISAAEKVTTSYPADGGSLDDYPHHNSGNGYKANLSKKFVYLTINKQGGATNLAVAHVSLGAMAINQAF